MLGDPVAERVAGDPEIGGRVRDVPARLLERRDQVFALHPCHGVFEER
jgi:hypothetical protein